MMRIVIRDAELHFDPGEARRDAGRDVEDALHLLEKHFANHGGARIALKVLRDAM